MRKILLVAGAILVAVAMTAVSASAAYRQRGSFAGGGPGPGGQGTADGQLRTPGAADVRTATGLLYVADTGNNRVQVFEPNASGGTYDAQLAITAPSGIAVDQSTGDVYVSNSAGVSKFDDDLEPVGGWAAPAPTGALSVDPTSGDLLVADQGGNLIRRYSSDGTPGPTFAAARPLDVAVDSNGDVIVVTSTGDIINACASSAVERYTSAGVREATIGTLSAPGVVAVDPDDDGVIVGAQVNQYNCDTGLLPIVAFFSSDGTAGQTVTLDPSTQWDTIAGIAAVGGGSSRVYAVATSPVGDEYGATRIAVLEDLTPPAANIDPVDSGSVGATTATFEGTIDPNGKATQFYFEYRIVGTTGWTSTPTQSSGSGSGFVPAGPVDVSGLRANSEYEVRLVARNADGDAVTAAEPFSTDAVAPVVETRLALGITATRARLNGLVDPSGLPTTYWVEYGPTEAYGARLPVSGGSEAGSGYGAVSVGQTVTDLQPSTTYHFRIVAENVEGVTQGADATFETTGTPTPVIDQCANAGIRSQQGATLLTGCRAYEMVSPTNKNGNDVLVWPGTIRSAADGGATAFSSSGAFGASAGSPTSVQYVSARNDSGWVTAGISPPQLPNGSYAFASTSYRGYTPDLRRGFGTVYPDPPLAAGAPQGVPNLYTRNLPTGAYTLLTGPAAGVPDPAPSAFGASWFAAASDDGSHVLFESASNLTSDATGFTTKLYESVDGEVSLAGVLPAGEGGGPAPSGSIAGYGAIRHTYTERTISRDGSRVFFTASPNSNGFGQVYVRVNGATQARVSAPASDAPAGAVQPAHYWTATADGRYVFFTSAQKLTADSTADPTAGGLYPIGKPDLYRYDVESGDLVDVSVSQTGTPAAVGGVDAGAGGLVGISADGDDVYFASSGRIVPEAPAAAELKLYHWEAGKGVAYVAPLSTTDVSVWYQGVEQNNTLQARVSSDGRRLLFVARTKLDPDRDNGGRAAVYMYSVDDDAIDCISCPGDGSAATANGSLGAASSTSGRLSSGTAAEGYARTDYLSRFLSDDGQRAFFMTADSLLPQDSNGKEDVYLWQDGTTSLISTGKSGDRSFFGDASPNGDQVFFATRERLVPQDTDNSLDVYDARVDGGWPEPAAAGNPCVSDACQGTPTPPPALPDAGSVTFSGDGNVAESGGGTTQPASPLAIAKVRQVVGTAATLRVSVPAAGSIRVSGASVRAAKKSATKRATYSVKIALTARAKRMLKTRGALKVRLKVVFAPKSGAMQSRTVTLTFKRPKPPARKHRSSGVRSATSGGAGI